MAIASAQRRLTVTLEADVASFQRGMVAAQKALQSASRSMIAIGQNLAFSIAAPLATISAGLVKMAGDFEKAGDNIVTQTQLSREEVEKLEKVVVSLSDAMPVDQIDLMKGALAVAGAGMRDAAAVTQTLTKAAQLNAVGLGEMDQIARTLVSTMTAFKTHGVNAAEASNAFLLAVQEGGFPAEQWASAIAKMGGNAVASGVSLQALTAGISAYTRITGDADEATTGFARILSDIAKPSEKARKMWDDMFEGGILEVRRFIQADFIGFMRELADELGRLPTEKFQEVAATLFDNERAARAFIGVFRGQGDDIVAMFNRIVGNTTALPKALNEIKDSWDYTWRGMKAQVVNLAVAMGEMLLPVVRDVGLTFAGWVNALRPLLQANSELIIQISLVTVGAIAAMVAIGVLGLAFSTLWSGVNLVIGAVTGLIGALGTLWAGLSAGVTALTAMGFVFTAPFIAATAAVFSFWAVFNLMSNDTTRLAKESASNYVKVWAIAITLVKSLFRGIGVAMLQGWTDFLKGALEAEQKERGRSPFEFMVGGKRVSEHALEGMISTSETMLNDWKSSLKTGAEDIQILFEQMVFGIKPPDLSRFPTLELDNLIVPGREIDKLNEAGLLVSSLTEDVKALSALDVQVWDVDLGEFRKATIDELREIQKEAVNLEPVEPEIFTFGEAADWAKDWREKFTGPEAVVADFVSRVKESLKEIGFDLSNFDLPTGDEEKLKKFATGMEKINGLIVDQSFELAKLRGGYTDFEIATIEGLQEIAKIGNEIGLLPKQIEAFQAAYQHLRVTLDAETRAAASLKELGDQVRDANIELGELTSGWDDYQIATQRGLQAFEAVDTSKWTNEQIKALHTLKLEWMDTRAAIERENEKIRINVGDAFLGAIDQITRGILQGTRSWRDILSIFADMGIGIWSQMLQDFLKKKLDFDDLMIDNFMVTLPEAIQGTVDALKKTSEVLAELSDAQVGELITGAAIEQAKQASEVLRELSDEALGELLGGAEPAPGTKDRGDMGAAGAAVGAGRGASPVNLGVLKVLQGAWTKMGGALSELSVAAQDAASSVRDFFLELFGFGEEAELTTQISQGVVLSFSAFYEDFEEAATPPSSLWGVVGKVRDFFVGLLDASALADGLYAVVEKVKGFFRGLLGLDATPVHDYARSVELEWGAIGESTDRVFRDMGEGIETFKTETLVAFQGLTAGVTKMIQMITGGGPKGKHDKAIRILGYVSSAAGALASYGSSFGSLFQSVSGSVNQASAAAAEAVREAGVISSISSMPTQQPIPLAGGGIVRRPTQGLVGEAGPEAVLPLSKMAGMFEQPETTVVVNSPHPATVRKTERDDSRLIEVIIDDAIARSVRTGGKASQSLERTFGLRRQGGTR